MCACTFSVRLSHSRADRLLGCKAVIEPLAARPEASVKLAYELWLTPSPAVTLK
jgi:hypothetical protein